jgi:prevent-host-death family protein
MPDSIDTYAAKTQLSRLLARVEAGEEITTTWRGTPVAKLVPVTPKPPVVFGVLKGKVWAADDFDGEDPEINALFYGEGIEPPK